MQVPAHGTRTVSEADFGRMKLLDELAAAAPSNHDLELLAAEMISPLADTAKDGEDDEENPYIPAGYTYFGQFVDHDLTFDTHSVFDDPTSFERASNMRTPRFDLDNVYGRGPDDQPYLFQDSFDGTLLLGEALDNGVKDVQRNAEGRAIIGDPRNDENSVVVQLQSAFIRFHNKMVGRAVAGIGTPKLSGRAAYLWAQTQTRHHYQRIVLDDYMPRIMDPAASTVSAIFSSLSTGHRPTLKLYDLDHPPYMPVEFSVAAYRFGHSMIRPGYRMSAKPGDVAQSGPDNVRLFKIFDGETGGLRGFQRLNKGKGIDWSLFFAKGLAAGTPLGAAGAVANNAKGVRRTQYAYKIDTMVVAPIGTLPHAVAFNPSSLALRNMMRGRDFGLPSGQDAARRIGAPVIADDKLSVRVNNDFANRKTIKAISPHFAGNAPLWFYILAEAEQPVIAGVAAGKSPLELGTRLGPLGGAIVLETVVGLMLSDPESVLNPRATWRSINGKPTFSMEELFAEIGTPLV